MKYPSLNASKAKNFTVNGLKGGCNRRDGGVLTADTQLIHAKNLWWKNGALRTRPGVSLNTENALIGDAEMQWKFCAEDTVQGGVYGRRFLQWKSSRGAYQTFFRTGILTYEGNFHMEGEFTCGLPDVTGMMMEYPYTAEENLLIFLSNGDIYAQSSVDFSWRNVTEEAYVPCILSDGRGLQTPWEEPSWGGQVFESRNLLTDRFCAKYTTTEGGNVFYLPVQGLDEEQSVKITITYSDGGIVGYTIPPGETKGEFAANDLRPVINRETGMFYFETPDGWMLGPIAGPTNNLVVTASKKRTAEERKRIAEMTFSTWFGGSQAGRESRQFLSGCPDVKNRVYWSGQGQPLYFPKNNYIAVGDINQAITAFGKQDGQLVLFKERETYSLSAPDGMVSEGPVDGQLSAGKTVNTEYFPLKQLHGHIGCLSPDTVQLCGNRLVWADGLGKVYCLNGSVSTGYTARELSYFLGPELNGYTVQQWKNAKAAVMQGHYLLLIDNTVYVLRIDEKAFKQYETAYDDSTGRQLAWFVWSLPETVKPTAFFGNGRDIVGLVPISAESTLWETPMQFSDETTEDRWQGAFRASYPITVYLCTKEYDFGDKISLKRILRIYLGLEATEKTKAQFYYICGGERVGEVAVMQGVTGNTVFSLTPNCARVRRFGFAMEAVGTVAVDTILFTIRS